MRHVLVLTMLLAASSAAAAQQVRPHGGIEIVDFPAPAKISDLEVLEFDGETVLLTWTAPADDSPDEAAILYEAQISDSPDFEVFESIGDLIPDAPGETEFLSIEGFEGGTWYFRVASQDNGLWWSFWSNVAEASVDDPQPSPSPTPEPAPSSTAAPSAGDAGNEGALCAGGSGAVGAGTLALLLAALPARRVCRIP